MNKLSKFLPTAEMQKEFEQYKQCKTEEERAEFQHNRAVRVNSLSAEERRSYEDAAKAGLAATLQAAEEKIAADKLGSIAQAVSLSYIAKHYFGKNRNWLYQRLNGYKVNGKPAQFSEQEKRKFAEALSDLSVQLQKTSLNFLS